MPGPEAARRRLATPRLSPISPQPGPQGTRDSRGPEGVSPRQSAGTTARLECRTDLVATLPEPEVILAGTARLALDPLVVELDSLGRIEASCWTRWCDTPMRSAASRTERPLLWVRSWMAAAATLTASVCASPAFCLAARTAASSRRTSAGRCSRLAGFRPPGPHPPGPSRRSWPERASADGLASRAETRTWIAEVDTSPPARASWVTGISARALAIRRRPAAEKAIRNRRASQERRGQMPVPLARSPAVDLVWRVDLHRGGPSFVRRLIVDRDNEGDPFCCRKVRVGLL